MDAMLTLNLTGYAAVAAGGFALGTLFGRKVAGEMLAMVHAVESRVLAVETAVRLGHAEEAHATVHALRAHAAAAEKLAAVIAAPHAGPVALPPAAQAPAATSAMASPAAHQVSGEAMERA